VLDGFQFDPAGDAGLDRLRTLNVRHVAAFIEHKKNRNSAAPHENP
jgi:hypothetical protein